MRLGEVLDWGVGLLPVSGVFAVCAIVSIGIYGVRVLRGQEIGAGKKAAKLVAVVVLWTVVGAMAVAGDLVRAVDTETVLAASDSPGGAYRLVVTSTSPLTFGAHGVTITLGRQGGSGQRIASTRLANDGKGLVYGRNCRVSWPADDRAEVWLWGEEQEAETMTVEIEGDRALVRTGSEVEMVALGGGWWSGAMGRRLPAMAISRGEASQASGCRRRVLGIGEKSQKWHISPAMLRPYCSKRPRSAARGSGPTAMGL